MIAIKNERELALMRQACKITAAARALAGEMVRPGVSTKEIDKAVHDFIVSQGAKPSFLGYHGYPGSACISVNEEVIHGIPGGRVLKDGDIVIITAPAYNMAFSAEKTGFYNVGKDISGGFDGLGDADKFKVTVNADGSYTFTSLTGKVIAMADYEASKKVDIVTGEETAIDLPKSNVLQYKLPNNSCAIVRPSGTEPKIKFYMEAKGTMATRADYAEADAKAAAKIEAMKKSLGI
mgnify:CR=1 FL=1